MWRQHSRVNFLDFDISAVYTTTSSLAYTGNLETPARISSTAHIIRGWLKADMHRLLTHSESSNVNIWLEECRKFSSLLSPAGKGLSCTRY